MSVAAGGAARLDPREPLVRAWREAKYCGPALFGSGLLVALAFVPGVLVSPGLTPLSVALAVVFAGPAWACCLAIADAVFRGAEPGLRDVPRELRRTATGGALTAAPVGLAVASFLAAWAGFTSTGQVLFLIPGAVAGAGSIVGMVGLPYALWLRERHGMRGRELWYWAIALVGARPVAGVGTGALLIVSLYMGVNWAFSLLLLMPAVLALVSVVAVRTALESVQPAHNASSPNNDPEGSSNDHV